MVTFRLFSLLVVLVAASVLSGAQRPGPVVEIQLLALNDFHGSLEPPTGTNGRIGETEAGGSEYLAAHIARLKADNPNTVVVSAGDNIGATPLISSMFHDEPTIEALGAAGLQISAVGNHELDEGWAELVRMQRGKCHPQDGCQDNTPFHGAPFEYLSANIMVDPKQVDRTALASSGWSRRNRTATLFRSSVIKKVGGVRVGFIGLTLQGTPRIVAPAGLKGLTFLPEAEAANAAARDLRRQGVRAMVVLIHEGGEPAGTDVNACDVSGPILEITRALSPDIDVVVSGHSHRAYVCTWGQTLVTSAASFGRLVTDIDLQIDRRTGDVASKSARNVIVSRDVPKDPRQTALIERYRPLAARVGARAVGSITAAFDRRSSDAGESVLGGMVADSMLDAAARMERGADVAFINPGGLRADLPYRAESESGAAGTITYADAFSVLPFGNVVVVRTLTGDAILRLLEEQFDNPEAGRNQILQVSRGFGYTYDLKKPRGQRVEPASVKLGDKPLEPATRYRVAMPDFLWSGGGGFNAVSEGTEPAAVGADVDVFVEYLQRRSPLSPGQPDRIRRLVVGADGQRPALQ